MDWTQKSQFRSSARNLCSFIWNLVKRGGKLALVFLVLYTLAFNLPVNGLAQAASVDNDKVTEIKIRATAFELSAYSNYGAMIDHLPHLADRQYIRKELGPHLKDPVRAQFLDHNSLIIFAEGERTPIEIIDLPTRHFSILKHDYIYDPQESAETAIKKLKRFVTQNEPRNLMNLFEPQAEAINYYRLGRWAFYVYSTIAVSLGYECAKQGWNSNGKCAEFGAEWPAAAGLFGVGLAVLGYQEAKQYTSDKTFELTDIICPSKGQPLVATIIDSKQKKLTLQLFSTPLGAPDHIDFGSEGSATDSLYFNSDWSPAPDRAPTKGTTFEARAAEVIAEGAKNLSRLCQGGADSRTALERYKKLKQGTMTVAPSSDAPTATVK